MNDMRARLEPESLPSRSLIVGIGASAEGLEALGRFFDNVPRESGMAFVIVGHPPGDAWTFADERLAKHTELPIHRVAAGMQVAVDNVYLVPPETPMTLSGGQLLPVEPVRGRCLDSMHTIDTFFWALADDCGPRSAAVVLSGGDADGALGLCHVHDAGGLVLLQDAAKAAFCAAPAGAVDWVLAPGEMPRVLAEHARKVARVLRPPMRAVASFSAAELLATFGTLLDKYLPPSLLLGDRGELLHAFGGAGRFLKLRGDLRKADDVLEVVHPELRVALGASLRALAGGSLTTPAAVGKGIRVAPGDPALYDVAIDRVHGKMSGGPLLVSFSRSGAAHGDSLFEHSEIRRVLPPASTDPGLSSTKELESLLSSLSDAVYFKDASGRFIRTNQVMAERLGLSEPAAAIGKMPVDMPHSSIAVAMHRDDEPVLRSGDAQHFRLERWETPAGAIDWALVTRLPLRGRSGDIVGMVGVFHDITDQKRAEEKVEEAVRRRDQFLAMLSHELRNPLGAIVTATALLKKRLVESEHARPLAILQRQSLQMARLLDDLLEANRVTENTIELRKEVVDLRVVAAEAVEASRPFMETRRVTFDATFGPEPLWVDGDPARLLQIQMHLLQNAARYTPGGGHVSIVLQRVGERATVRVCDDGAGIAHEMLESVFDLFVQTGRKLDRSQGGIGLGLTLVRSLVTMHGGTVTAQSEGEGKGAEFVVNLPLASAPPGYEPGSARGQKAWARLPAHAKIAIIEDSADNRELLVEVLTAAGFACQAAENGVEGLALIEALRPDLALVDLGLPGINGFEVARRVRAEPRNANIRLVALTGYGMREDRARALAAGFDDHLVKPIETTALVNYLESDPVKV
jgi:PAS domain S-box-containing protein